MCVPYLLQESFTNYHYIYIVYEINTFKQLIVKFEWRGIFKSDLYSPENIMMHFLVNT